MEKKIGEIFEIDGEWYQCIKGLNCLSCVFNGSGNCDKILCSLDERTDSTSVFFKKLEKVGEPILFENKIMQRYKVFVKPYISKELGYFNINSTRDLTILIEIKQTKEDMEGKTNLYEKQTPLQKLMEIYCDGRMDYNEFEKKVKELYSDKGDDSKPNLKPFDLEAAKAGKPVCARDGRKARIICWDRKDIKPIVALVTSINGDNINEKAFYYFEDGQHLSKYDNNINDLMMLPEKKEGWVNVYDDTPIYDTKEEALNRRSEFRGYIDTIKVSWEE